MRVVNITILDSVAKRLFAELLDDKPPLPATVWAIDWGGDTYVGFAGSWLERYYGANELFYQC